MQQYMQNSYYNLNQMIACVIQEWKCYMARTISGWAVVANVMHQDLRQPFQDTKATVMCLENSTLQPDVWDLEFLTHYHMLRST